MNIIKTIKIVKKNPKLSFKQKVKEFFYIKKNGFNYIYITGELPVESQFNKEIIAKNWIISHWESRDNLKLDDFNKRVYSVNLWLNNETEVVYNPENFK